MEQKIIQNFVFRIHKFGMFLQKWFWSTDLINCQNLQSGQITTWANSFLVYIGDTIFNLNKHNMSENWSRANKITTKINRSLFASRCNGVKDCQEGEDEDNCEEEVTSVKTQILIVFAVCAQGIIITVGVFFILRRWKRNRRLRQASDSHSLDVDVRVRVHVSRDGTVHGETSNPVFGLPPPFCPDDSNAQMIDITAEFPPPYILKAPSNEGPKSVLPTYNEATSSASNQNTSLPNETASQSENDVVKWDLQSLESQSSISVVLIQTNHIKSTYQGYRKFRWPQAQKVGGRIWVKFRFWEIYKW